MTCVPMTSRRSTVRPSASTGWPAYNIETTGENAYRIEIAVAGFKPDELNIEVKENLLTVTGRKTANDEGARELPEARKPRRIEIGTGSGQPLIEGKKAKAA